MNALDKALSDSRARVSTSHEMALRRKGVSIQVDTGSGTNSSILDWGRDRGMREQYGQFRGWLYAAVNAISREAAAQPVQAGRLLGVPVEDEEEKRRIPTSKRYNNRKLPRSMRVKAAEQEWEMLQEHPFVAVLEQPNPMQNRWEFVYSFVANLCLTGWAYVVWGDGPNGLEIYSLPSTWVTPKHDKGPFSSFLIGNPNNPDQSKKIELTRDNVAVARMPNPADPMSAVAPAQSQISAIRVDDNIQSSQEVFFENGVFPSVIISIGKDPHPEVAGGIRPRLTAPQRRQVVAAIQQTMSGVANYGNPAIVDGMIESIDRLGSTQPEMGWEKSEQTVRTRILSAFGVHPFILGETVNVGGYAQAREIKERFFAVVNSYLDMLSTVVSKIAEPLSDNEGKLFVWWEPLEAEDPSIRAQTLREARKNGDITKNEMRSELGFPPDETQEATESRAPILDTVGGIQGAVSIMSSVGLGQLAPDSAAKLMSLFFQIPLDRAEAIVGLRDVGTYQQVPTLPDQDDDEEDQLEDVEDEMDTIRQAVRLLGIDPVDLAARVVKAAK